MAATAVRYLRAAGSAASAPAAPGAAAPDAPPDSPGTAARPVLRAVREDERAPVDRNEFRRVLGHFASGVTVVTAPGDAADPAPAGFACQSFASLSLDPPLVAFMVARTSTTWPRIARAGVFCVNVLGAGQAGLCRGFAVSGADKFAGVRHTPAPVSGSPLLAGVPAWIDCTIQAVHTGGDHLVVVGRVDALGTDEAAAAAGPLLFHRGAFGEFRAHGH
ncbi:NADPH-flavin oxidoreductase [Streptomyces sp. Ru73]|uniref:flavin reductase family protein n=1 Tax=Streptomyces sp. Ru73 TaxID=2080748 RepID=UPI000CDD246C|nr:flavin reductase family protein [Streptomyces sp. Ru73]POX37154.1 NADPH-flavin oxidoreductase [Streptomyces sp. Ru73]